MTPRTPLETYQMVSSALSAISPALLLSKILLTAKSIAW